MFATLDLSFIPISIGIVFIWHVLQAKRKDLLFAFLLCIVLIGNDTLWKLLHADFLAKIPIRPLLILMGVSVFWKSASFFQLRPFLLFVAISFIVITLSQIINANEHVGLYLYLINAMCLLILAQFAYLELGSKSFSNLIIWIFIISATVLSFITILSQVSEMETRNHSLFGANASGVFLVLCLPAISFYFHHLSNSPMFLSKYGKLKLSLSYYAVQTLIVCQLIVFNSRQAFFLYFICLICSIIFIYRPKKLALAFSFFSGLTLLIYLLPSKLAPLELLQSRISNSVLYGINLQAPPDSSSQTRFMILEKLYESDVSFLGHGILGFRERITRVASENVFVEVLGYFGIFGLLVFTTGMAMTGSQLWKHYKAAPDGHEKKVSSTLLILFSLNLISGCFNDLLFQTQFWAILGVCLAWGFSNAKIGSVPFHKAGNTFSH